MPLVARRFLPFCLVSPWPGRFGVLDVENIENYLKNFASFLFFFVPQFHPQRRSCDRIAENGNSGLCLLGSAHCVSIRNQGGVEARSS